MPPISDSPFAVSGCIAFIGGGNLARSSVGALIRHGARADSIAVAAPNGDLRAALARDFGVHVHPQASDATRQAKVQYFLNLLFFPVGAAQPRPS